METNASIFRAYDIRGKYGEEFDNEFARKLGMVLAKYLSAKKIVISRDARASSKELAEHVSEGIISAGCDAIDIGPTSTPLFYFGVIDEKSDGGIMVTASHLGDEFNGFKITRKKAVAIGGDELFAKTANLFDSELKAAQVPGKVLTRDLLAHYVATMVERSGLQVGDINVPIRLMGNEMILKEARAMARELSIPVVEKGEEISFEFDADGDRLYVYNSKGKKISGDLMGGLLAGYYFSGQKIVYDLGYSRGVLEYLHSKDIETISSPIGHTLIKARMREHKAEFCGERSGHIFFEDTGYVEAPLLASLKILNILQTTGHSIDELVLPISKWSTSEEINFTFSNRKKITEIISKIREYYNDADINETDGIRAEYPDWSFLLRASNTEEKLRLIVDARTEKLLRTKVQELQKRIG